MVHCYDRKWDGTDESFFLSFRLFVKENFEYEIKIHTITTISLF